MLKQVDDAVEVLLPQALGDARVVVGRDYLQPRGRLRRVRAYVRVARDRVAIAEQVGDRGRRLAPDAICERAGVGVAVQRDDAITAVRCERMSELQRRRGLADAALARHDGDALAA